MAEKIKIELIDVNKVFNLGRKEANDVQVVFDINLKILEKDFVIICGPSGSGKSTILNILIGLEDPTRGKVLHNNVDIYQTSQDKRANYRLKNIGVVMQQSVWLKNMSVIENVAMPHFLSGHDYKESLGKAKEMLKMVKMESFIKRFPSELSGGQQQKIALVRCLINDPEIIVADEPTGNLDTDSSLVLIDKLQELNQKYGKTVIMVTHNLSYLKLTDKKYYVKDGRLSKLNYLLNNVPDNISKVEQVAK